MRAWVLWFLLVGCGASDPGDDPALGAPCVGGVTFDASGAYDSSRTCGALQRSLAATGVEGLRYGCVGPSGVEFLYSPDEQGTCGFVCERCDSPETLCAEYAGVLAASESGAWCS